MNKALRIPDYLEHILEAIERIESYTEDVDETSFLNNGMVQDAVIRNIEIIGEASNNIQRVFPEFASLHDDIPWQVMYAMRNRVSHGYHKVDLEVIWKTIHADLPELYQLVKKALQSLSRRDCDISR